MPLFVFWYSIPVFCFHYSELIVAFSPDILHVTWSCVLDSNQVVAYAADFVVKFLPSLAMLSWKKKNLSETASENPRSYV